VNRNFPKLLLFNDSSLGCLLTLLLMGLLLGSVGLGWLVNGLLIFFVILAILPAIAWWGFRWWLQRSIVVDRCPVCSYEFTGFKGSECICPNCQEPLKVESGGFHRLTPPGTIDVQAVEVPLKQIEE
jgi:hypothetical protein